MLIIIINILFAYLLISLIIATKNITRHFRVLFVFCKYHTNFKKHKPYFNKDLECSVIHLSSKAGINYYKYINSSDILQTIADPYYTKNYNELFQDISSRFRQKIGASFAWPLHLFNKIRLFIYYHTPRRANGTVKGFVFSIIGMIAAYLFGVYMDKHGYGLNIIDFLEPYIKSVKEFFQSMIK